MKKHLFCLMIILCMLGCEQKKPSTYEIHYAGDRKDSAVLVNYSIDADSTHSFYLNYDLFFDIYRQGNLDVVYDYYLQHSELRRSQTRYKNYMLLKYCFHHQTDTAQSEPLNNAGSREFENKAYEREYIKPTMPYHQPSRGH